MIPVLLVKDTEAARTELENHFGLRRLDDGRMAFGDQKIVIARQRHEVSGLTEIALDHIAFRVADAGQSHESFRKRGARLDPRFTPDGPAEIPDFGEHGVRYVFFVGPEGCSIEFCEHVGEPPAAHQEDLSHLAIRTANEDAAEEFLATLGARRSSEYALSGPSATISVRFLKCGSGTFEIFDEAPFASGETDFGWVGCVLGE